MTPMSRKTSRVRAWSARARDWSVGPAFGSMIRQRTPCRRSSQARVRPTGPAPATRTSASADLAAVDMALLLSRPRPRAHHLASRVRGDATGADERDPLRPRGPDHDRLDDRLGDVLLGGPFDQEARRRATARVALLDEEVDRGQRRELQRPLHIVADEPTVLVVVAHRGDDDRAGVLRVPDAERHREIVGPGVVGRKDVRVGGDVDPLLHGRLGAGGRIDLDHPRPRRGVPNGGGRARGMLPGAGQARDEEEDREGRVFSHIAPGLTSQDGGRRSTDGPMGPTGYYNSRT